jgi:DNA-binding LytR/AlgR family response regulator
MIRIAIVEDDTGYRSQLGKYIDQYQSDFSETVSVSEFSDGLEIVEKYKSEYDIILMDIQMKHMDGMQAAMRIRDMDKNVIIIFITNSAQFAVQGYKVEALDYVLKPIQYFAFSQVLHNAVKKVYGKSKFYIHLIQESKMIRLDADQILYIESRGHTIIYHTEIGEYAERGSYTSGADEYLCLLINQIIPKAESLLQGTPAWRGIAGYSLAGLFALYSIYQTDAFSRVASVSGSLWFPGIKEYVVSRTPVKKPADIFFSLGDRECRTQNSLLRCVQQNTESIERYYHEQGIDTTFQLNPGNHFKDVVQRTAAGLQWLLSREYDP